MHHAYIYTTKFALRNHRYPQPMHKEASPPRMSQRRRVPGNPSRSGDARRKSWAPRRAHAGISRSSPARGVPSRRCGRWGRCGPARVLHGLSYKGLGPPNLRGCGYWVLWKVRSKAPIRIRSCMCKRPVVLASTGQLQQSCSGRTSVGSQEVCDRQCKCWAV